MMASSQAIDTGEEVYNGKVNLFNKIQPFHLQFHFPLHAYFQSNPLKRTYVTNITLINFGIIMSCIFMIYTGR